MREREFTLEEAHAALRVARPAFLALREAQRQMRSARGELAELHARYGGNGRGYESQEQALRERLNELGTEARDRLAELRATGAEVKGLEQGLLDFPARIAGEQAYWCWRVGEPEIAWWHPRNSGFGGRRPIADLT